MNYLAVDLGTTNIKIALYDENLKCLTRDGETAHYEQQEGFVEFNADVYADAIMDMSAKIMLETGTLPENVSQVILTGQAESLVILDAFYKPLMNAISWMDERSSEECKILESQFPADKVYKRTGQMAMLPTWPATKILWLKRYRPDIFENAVYYVLLKDYIVFRLTGKLLADCSIATFSLYFDIYRKKYWNKMLSACGIREDQLPRLSEPCSCAGTLLNGAAGRMGLSENTRVNIGTLDHFAGMIGTGNIDSGTVSLSIGTVMALAAITGIPFPSVPADEKSLYTEQTKIAIHYGFLPDSYVMLPVSESGGICLEWFRNSCLPGVSFDTIDNIIKSRAAGSPG